ncbi:cytochrome P450 89A2-like [Dioscorea cayenensis subsp. rotundata]|uniref:Cytochrome P450 89A2-like n=1 Tax=Dioscorea cayennensis subsp. rotundata TaxID=55577 RepID=A0AB40C305_DIOCR|nr:cytochrome P450 89A2-like [Dioscorea cayenensis subsp. rotundata]
MAPILLIFIFVTISFSLLLNRRERIRRIRLPPSPPTIPLLGNLLWLTKPFSQLEPTLHHLRAKYGPIFTLYVGARPVIFIMDGDHIHRSLVENGEVFADRPRPVLGSDLNTNLHSINNTPYGSLWRLLRRNLASEVIHPCKATTKSSTHVHRMALNILLNRLKNESKANGGVVIPIHSIKNSLSFLMISLCFGIVKLDEQMVKQIQNVQWQLLFLVDKHFALNLMPKVALLLFLGSLRTLKQLRRAQKELLIPLIRARKQLAIHKRDQRHVISYVDSLLELRVPNGVGNVRELSEEDIVSFCSEFLDASIWSTCAGLEWIMASLVKHQDVQKNLKQEINGVVGDEKREIHMDELQRMPYLKAVIFEALRRHPPAHFLIPHRVKQDVLVDEYLIPKDAVMNCLVTGMGLDGRVWEEPLEFKPERFMAGGEGEGVDVQCGKSEIKMMPFGTGRRMCPGLDMAMIQLQYFVANLVNEMEFKEVEGMEVDLSEKAELFVPMKNPFHAQISFA